MDPQKHKDKPEIDMHTAHRRLDTALTIASITLAAAFVGIGAYAAIWYFILPLLGVETC